jgi:hypothetical protein
MLLKMGFKCFGNCGQRPEEGRILRLISARVFPSTRFVALDNGHFRETPTIRAVTGQLNLSPASGR